MSAQAYETMRTTLFSLTAAAVLLAATGCNPPGSQDTARTPVEPGQEGSRLSLREGATSIDPTASTNPVTTPGNTSGGSLQRLQSGMSRTPENSSDKNTNQPAPNATNRPNAPTQPGGQGQGQRGTRGMGGMGAAMMLGSDEMKKELKITEAQSAELKKLMDGAMAQFRGGGGGERPDPQKMQEQVEQLQAKVEKILNAEQRQRLDEISLQTRGAAALRDEDIQKKLGMTANQIAQIEKIDAESRAEMEKLRESAGEGERPDFTKIREMREASNKKLLAVLSASQVQKFEAMKGKPFTMPQRQRGGGPGGGAGSAR